MRFTPTPLNGAFVIDPDRIPDERGFFARTWCRDEFQEHGLDTRIVQCNTSYNRRKGTLRGMHYQIAPFEEIKLVRCTRGSIYDVIIDLRRASPTYMRHFGINLKATEGTMLYIPEGFAHGFMTLEDDTEVFYQMSQYYDASSARGVRWDDPAFGIRWPGDALVISDRDRNHPRHAPNA